MTRGATRDGSRLFRASQLWPALAAVLILALLAAGAIRALAVQSFSVSSGSMQPTLQEGDRVTVWRPDALGDVVDRGDIVVFDGRGSFIASAPPNGVQQLGSWFGLGPGDVFFVKRVVAVGGDSLQCCDDAGRLLRDGEPLDEPYLDPAVSASEIEFSVVVPPDRIWVMGDNRPGSTDSRALLGRPGGGMIPVDRVLGTVIGHGSSIDR